MYSNAFFEEIIGHAGVLLRDGGDLLITNYTIIENGQSLQAGGYNLIFNGNSTNQVYKLLLIR